MVHAGKAKAAAAVTAGGGSTRGVHTLQPSPAVTAVALRQWDWCRRVGEGPRGPEQGAGDV